MKFKERIHIPGTGEITVHFESTPDKCPECHTAIQPVKKIASDTADSSKFVVVFQCTSAKCRKLFIAYYEVVKKGTGHVGYFQGSKPKSPQKATFPECVGNVSNNFINIYNQALAAESEGLDEISGIGLRKALEFLVKDFLKKEHPDKTEVIEKAFLGKCIKDFIKDPQIKICSERAVWLGNDHAHYVKKWADKDITDLKTLIKLTVNWIENVELTRQYEEEMPPNQ